MNIVWYSKNVFNIHASLFISFHRIVKSSAELSTANIHKINFLFLSELFYFPLAFKSFRNWSLSVFFLPCLNGNFETIMRKNHDRMNVNVTRKSCNNPPGKKPYYSQQVESSPTSRHDPKDDDTQHVISHRFSVIIFPSELEAECLDFSFFSIFVS